MKYLLLSMLLLTPLLSQAVTPKRSIAQEAKMLVEDTVYKVLPAGNAEKVLFRKHSGIYYLRSDSKHYETIRKALSESAKSGEKVKVKADADTMEIEEIILQTK